MAARRISSLILPGSGPHDQKSPTDRSVSPGEGFRGRLKKAVPSSPKMQSRSVSAQISRSSTKDSSNISLPNLQEQQEDEALGGPLMPPPPLGSSRPNSRPSSRPSTPGQARHSSTPQIAVQGASPIPPPVPQSPGMSNQDKRRSTWFRGPPKKPESSEQRGPTAWVSGHSQKIQYDTQPLLQAQQVPELWDNTDGNCYIYLYPRMSGKGPSFKVDSAIFASSPVLTRIAFGDLAMNGGARAGAERKQWSVESRVQNLHLNDPTTPPLTPKRHGGSLQNSSSTSSRDSNGRAESSFSESSQEAHLYLPIKLSTDGQIQGIPSQNNVTDANGRNPAADDLQTLIDIRNFFAFLCGQSLVGTKQKSSNFHIFRTVAGILRSYEFSNLDGSTFGEVASSSFDSYVEELGLADVRGSREKTIEGIVLGERMKSILLFNEAFTHAAGKHQDLVTLRSNKLDMITPRTQNRLSRAAMDLDKRTQSIRHTLTDFDFPMLFSGIMNSKMSVERKEGVKFEPWKSSWSSMRKWFMGLLKQRYGNWPPKASSKKNMLETSGLNRLVLKDLYHDMSSLYDLLVDRDSLTTRTVDGIDLAGPKEEPRVRGLRLVLSEYDRAAPPVKPPIPFDLPRFPTLKGISKDYGINDKKDQRAAQRKLKDDELTKVLRASWNDDAAVNPFVDAFRDMERRVARGASLAELQDLRVGQWIFMYVVLQALPMLALDAPGLKWTEGVEYFLCEPPRSGVPWAHPNPSSGGTGVASAGGARTWFSVGEGGGVVSLPSDVVEHGVEGIYRRSHCWAMAEKWSQDNPILNDALHEQEAMNAAASAAEAAGGDAFPSPPAAADLPAPPSTTSLLMPGSRSSSPGAAGNRASKRASTFGLGLEALPLPIGVTPDGSAPTGYAPYSPGATGGAGVSPGPGGRPSSTAGYEVDSSKTFDAILGGIGGGDAGKGKGRGKK